MIASWYPYKISKKPLHLKRIKKEIGIRSTEISLGVPEKRRLFHLWITTEIKLYIGVRLFEDIPPELTEMCVDLVKTYRKRWQFALELPPFNISYTMD